MRAVQAVVTPTPVVHVVVVQEDNEVDEVVLEDEVDEAVQEVVEVEEEVDKLQGKAEEDTAVVLVVVRGFVTSFAVPSTDEADPFTDVPSAHIPSSSPRELSRHPMAKQAGHRRRTRSGKVRGRRAR